MIYPRTRSPRGRGIFSVALFLLAFCVNFSLVQSALLGIDLGSEYFKTVLVKPGVPFEIVPSRDSKRKELAALSFKPAGPRAHIQDILPQRFYGTDTLSFQTRFPASSYSNLKELLGLPSENETLVEEYKQRYPDLKLVTVKETGTVGFDASIVEKDAVFTVEELLAMELQNIKDSVQTLVGKDTRIDGVVITIPPFWSIEEKKAVLTAAKLADLKVWSLIPDGTAVGLQYATTRFFPNSAKGEVPEYHMIFDIGSQSTSAAVLKFESRDLPSGVKSKSTIQQITALGTGWDRTLGGDTLTRLIVDDMIEKFVATPAAKSEEITLDDVKSSGRALSKFWQSAQKLRQVLSANKEASVGVESAFQDVDFRYTLLRSEFENMAESIVPRIERAVKQALERASLKVEDLDSIILHGGVIRTPFVQEVLASIVGESKIKATVNSDETAAFGATFRAAQLSSLFRVRDIRYINTPNNPFHLERLVDGQVQRDPLFAINSLDLSRNVTFSDLDNLSFSIVEELPSGKNALVQSVQAVEVSQSVEKLVAESKCSKDKISALFSVQMYSDWGVPQVLSGFVQCDIPHEAASSSGAAETASVKNARVPLKFKVTSQSDVKFSPELFSQAQDRIARLNRSDQLHLEHAELLNGLEAYVYKSRALVEDEAFIQHTTPENIQNIRKVSSEVSNWVNTEAISATIPQLREQYEALSSLIKPVTDSIEAAEKAKRAAEEEEKKKLTAVANFRTAFDEAKKLIEVVREQIAEAEKKPKEDSHSESSSNLPFVPYTLEDIAKLEELYKSSTWLNEKLSAPGGGVEYAVKDLEEKTKALQRESVAMLEQKMKHFEKFAENAGKKARGKSNGGDGSDKKGSSSGNNSSSKSSTSSGESTKSAVPTKDEL